jgi:hypothetical protein
MHLHNIDGVEIPFDSNWDNIAISVSGGADSALLAYLVCELADKHNITVHIINHVRMWKTRPWQQWDSKAVYDWLFKKFDHLQFQKHVNFIAPELEYGNIGPTLVDEYEKSVSGDNIEQRAYAEYICHHYACDAYYNAVTRNPRGIDLGGMVERDIERTNNNSHLEIMQHMNCWALHPFRFVEKSWVVAQYERLDIWELFERTRSCEGEFKNINYQTYTPGQYIPTCGKCFWCKEREWAVEKNKS